MSRRLTAIEIAEGALLADIAIALELLSIYMPYLSLLARLLIPIVFVVLVLRRGLYVSMIALSVAAFIVAIMTGFHYLMPMLFAGGTGLYLGTTMKRRWPHAGILLLGVSATALLLWGLSFLFALLAGVPPATMGQWFQKSYQTLMSFADLLVSPTELAPWWRQTAHPAIESAATILLTYWWATYLVFLWLLLWPVVTATYLGANLLMRQMGYQVIPFPGGGIERRVRRMRRRLAREGIRWGILRRRRATS